MATNLGIERKRLPEVPALTLGVADIPPIDMAEAYDAFPNFGVHVESIYIKKVYNQNGVLLENNDSVGGVTERSKRAFSQQTGWEMVNNMQLVVNSGTGTAARVSGVQIGGKTGTCDDFGDAWFCGYSPEVVCTVWVGNDDFNDKMSRMFGGDTPARTFRAIMSHIYGKDGVSRYKKTKFDQPDGTSFAKYGTAVGWPAGARLPGAKKEEKKEEAPAAGGGSDNNKWNPPNDAGDVFF
jgi:penicillin-binding protein 1A